ncbi:MAG: AMP-binding protein [Streptosporangiaceae bacterium]|nr:AMP-binding protein [Streptosporangiaceae bacterium]MBV9858117.1 AMP-binding protein [Streptosporangiaceae bacterium]
MELFNAADYLVGRHEREGRGGRVAVVSPAGELSYSGLATRIRRFGAGLADIGVRPGERVLMIMADDIDLFTAILATMYIGAIAVPCSTMLTAAELAPLVGDARARVVLGSPEFAGIARAAARQAPEVEEVIVAGTGAWQNLLGMGGGAEPYPA